MNRFRADLLLLLTAVIWGSAFIAQKNANEVMPPLLFVGIRFLISALLLIPLAVIEARKQSAPLRRINIVLGLFIGFCLFCGSCLQQIGLITSSATHGGFLTALYVVFVPIMMWLILRVKPRAIVILAAAISICGAWMLAGNGSWSHWERGDILILTADIAWSLAIMLIPVFLARAHRPIFLAFIQFTTVAVLGTASSALFETGTLAEVVKAAPALLYAGVISGALAFTLQIIAQKHTPAAEASLIMSLESVFAALSGALLLGEQLTLPALLGCALILLGIVLVEAGPLLHKLKA